jgi:hypothetical protein
MSKEMKKIYVVFSFVDKNRMSGLPTDCHVLFRDNRHDNEYPSREEAQKWIEESGSRMTDYTILEIFRKP